MGANPKATLVLILNTEIALNRLLNALGHMAYGMGHRFKGTPNVHVFFGDSQQVRSIRKLAYHLNSENKEITVFSDFPDTKLGKSTWDLLA